MYNFNAEHLLLFVFLPFLNWYVEIWRTKVLEVLQILIILIHWIAPGPTRDDRFWLGVVPVLCAVLSSGLTAALTQRALKGAQGRKLGQIHAKPFGLGRF